VSTRKPARQANKRYWRGQSPANWNAKKSLALLGAGAALLFFLSPLLGENGLPVFLNLRRERDQLRDEVKQYQQQAAELEEKITAIQQNAAALELFVREKYGMHGPDEKVVEIVDKRTPTEAP
jgi:cell division protein FtsB